MASSVYLHKIKSNNLFIIDFIKTLKKSRDLFLLIKHIVFIFTNT